MMPNPSLQRCSQTPSARPPDPTTAAQGNLSSCSRTILAILSDGARAQQRPPGGAGLSCAGVEKRPLIFSTSAASSRSWGHGWDDSRHHQRTVQAWWQACLPTHADWQIAILPGRLFVFREVFLRDLRELRCTGLSFYFLLNTDGGVGWVAGWAGGRFPTSLCAIEK